MVAPRYEGLNVIASEAWQSSAWASTAVDSSTKLSQVSRQMLSHLVIDISLLVCG
jgi:hypothetical protein